MDNEKHRRIVSSALWSAYGDALGFMTELADQSRVIHRTGQSSVTSTKSWRRKIGSKIGVFVEFPAGTYSDDTQLRLATSRAIRADGTFDVAAFAKVELPAWANYALGAGLSSKEAANNLARTSATWYSNFYETKRSSYVHAGGNGGAMRIQPHVWAAKSYIDFDSIFLDVFKNTICTHGHPRAFVGACFHALSLGLALDAGRPMPLNELILQTDELRNLPRLVEADHDLTFFWLGAWQEKTKSSFQSAVDLTVDEIVEDLELLQSIETKNVENNYERAVAILDAASDQNRGSATKTAILASYLSYLYRDAKTDKAMEIAANMLGSDTDSIATMAGAILGACNEAQMSYPIQDKAYLLEEAERMVAVSNGDGKRSFSYPDLRKWKPQRIAVDAISLTNDGLILNGVARAARIDSPPLKESQDIQMAWLRLSFGQTILARIRNNPAIVTDIEERVVTDRQLPRESNRDSVATKNYDLFAASKVKDSLNPNTKISSKTLNEILNDVINSNFDPRIIGESILNQADKRNNDFVERSIALTANIITAYRARLKK
ncbi:ADP-ribosylglycohydrolase family protein [Brucella sp. TWI432]